MFLYSVHYFQNYLFCHQHRLPFSIYVNKWIVLDWIYYTIKYTFEHRNSRDRASDIRMDSHQIYTKRNMKSSNLGEMYNVSDRGPCRMMANIHWNTWLKYESYAICMCSTNSAWTRSLDSAQCGHAVLVSHIPAWKDARYWYFVYLF